MCYQVKSLKQLSMDTVPSTGLTTRLKMLEPLVEEGGEYCSDDRPFSSLLRNITTNTVLKVALYCVSSFLIKVLISYTLIWILVVYPYRCKI